MRVVRISKVFVGSGGMFAMVCEVVLVKGRSWCISVMRPPPPPCCLSFRVVVNPGNLGLCFVCVSLVSWIVAMWILYLFSMCLSSFILFPMPSTFICSMFMLFIVVGRFGACCVGRVGRVGGGGGRGGRGWVGLG